MPDPKWKADGIDDFIFSAMRKHRVTTIKDGGCMTCDTDDIKFDEMSEIEKSEYRISGMCSDCQRSVFG